MANFNVLQKLLSSHVLLMFFLGSATSSGADGWGYYTADGPSTWPANFTDDCAGKKQSPIDIIDMNAEAKAVGIFSFNGLGEDPPKDGVMILTNNGHNAQVNLQGAYTMSGAGLPDTFNIVQFHFHWGNVSTVGSEHQLNSHQYAVEMHMVGFNSQYSDLSTAAGHDDGVAVVATFIEVGDMDNADYAKLINGLSRVIYKDQTYNFTSLFPIIPMLPSNLAEYYRYNGSLTTPTCQESVIWSVMKNPVQLSEQQIEKFRDLMFNVEVDTNMNMVNNYRPPQDLNEREVFFNDISVKDDAPSARPLWPIMALSLLLF